MITITPEYETGFLQVYVKKTQGGNYTGDRILFLMLTLPLAVRNSISTKQNTHFKFDKAEYLPLLSL